MYDFYKNFTFLSKNLFFFNEIIDFILTYLYTISKNLNLLKKICAKKIN